MQEWVDKHGCNEGLQIWLGRAEIRWGRDGGEMVAKIWLG